MRLCIFSGTFNPVHKAHLKMAQYVLDNFEFQKILFIPAYKPPHKIYDINMSKHRFNMLKLAISHNPNFDISDVEFQSEGKSYTYLTVKKLYELYKPEGKINLIIGTDAFEKIETWYETDKLKEIVEFIVFMRENKPVNLDWLKNKGYNFKVTKMDFFDISSTELRNLIKNNKSVNSFLTQEVEEYIKANGLYRD